MYKKVISSLFKRKKNSNGSGRIRTIKIQNEPVYSVYRKGFAPLRMIKKSKDKHG